MKYEINTSLFEPLYAADIKEFDRIRFSEFDANRAKRSALEKAFDIKKNDTIAYVKNASGAITTHLSMREGRPEEIHLPEEFNRQLYKEQNFMNEEWAVGRKQHTLLQERFKMIIVTATEGFFVNEIHIKEEIQEYERISAQNHTLIVERHNIINNFFATRNGVPADLQMAMKNELERFQTEWGPAGAVVSSINKRNAMRLAAQQDSWIRHVESIKYNAHRIRDKK